MTSKFSVFSFVLVFCVLRDIIFGYLRVMKLFSWKLHCFPFQIWARGPSGNDFCTQHEEGDQVRRLSFPTALQEVCCWGSLL